MSAALLVIMLIQAASTNSYATGSVSGNGNDVGGLVGCNNYSSSITNSYATGSVSGSSSDVGGLVGNNYSSASTTAMPPAV